MTGVPGGGPTAEALPPMLTRLAGERATGALLRDVGTLYLLDGAVVHAESPRSPGIGVLLTAGGLPAAAWREAVDTAGARREVARYLVERHLLSCASVQMAALAALFDAAFFALGPSGGPASFRHGAAHWFGVPVAVPVAALRRETARRRGLLEAVWPYPALDHAPVVRRAVPGLPRVTARQAALLAVVDGVRTPAGLAAARGRPGFDVLLDVRRLAALGHLATPRGAPPPAPPVPPPGAVGGGAMDVAMLRRVRDALETRL